MMDLNTALGLLMLIPAIIALVQEGKDNAVKSTAGIMIALSAIVVLIEYVGFINDLFNERIWWQILSVACAVLGTILVVRLKNQVIGTLLVTASGLLALLHLGVVDLF